MTKKRLKEDRMAVQKLILDNNKMMTKKIHKLYPELIAEMEKHWRMETQILNVGFYEGVEHDIPSRK